MNNMNLDSLMELIDSVKMYSGCDEVKLVGNNKAFEKLIAMGFPLGEFKCENTVELDESNLWIMPTK